MSYPTLATRQIHVVEPEILQQLTTRFYKASSLSLEGKTGFIGEVGSFEPCQDVESLIKGLGRTGISSN
ncbi:hypothetical protein VNO77_24756 [Canavalia gladiata]|uniref:Uncharacterized protein n=1 Tax=Canavalia gladiata TaxID=3824 RepID=A0AAN9QCV3_CANGL